MAQPAIVLSEKTPAATVAVGKTFQITLPQDPASGSWNYSQSQGPVALLSGGSHINPDGTEEQTFNFQGASAGTEQLTFSYSGGKPPGPPSVTFSITVTP